MRMIDLIAGARPNFMKIAPIIDALKASGKIRFRLIHTGQHYDRNMSGSFFEELGIPEPEINLQVGSGTQAEQTAGIMVGYEKVLLKERSDLCLVVGDVTSTMACAITAQKLCVPVAHVEGGIRSGDWTMPEEINRMVTDAITNLFFTTSDFANENLKQAGVGSDRIFFVGNTMIDTLIKQLPRLKCPSFYDEAGLVSGQYMVLTLHRPANVDDPDNLRKMLDAVMGGTRSDKVVWPVHPRTRKILAGIGDLKMDRLILCEPLSYLEFNYLVRYSRGVITDSGGITEETTVMGVPCMTLRDTTERPETVQMGTNELVGTNPANLQPYLQKLFSGEWKKGKIPPLWDGKAAVRIVQVLERHLHV